MTPILDWSRRLNAYTFTPSAPPPRCFVLGCGKVSAGLQDHFRFGLVECCPDHDPSKHGMARKPGPSCRCGHPANYHEGDTGACALNASCLCQGFTPAEQAEGQPSAPAVQGDGGSNDDGGTRVPVAPRVPKLPPGGATVIAAPRPPAVTRSAQMQF